MPLITDDIRAFIESKTRSYLHETLFAEPREQRVFGSERIAICCYKDFQSQLAINNIYATLHRLIDDLDSDVNSHQLSFFGVFPISNWDESSNFEEVYEDFVSRFLSHLDIEHHYSTIANSSDEPVTFEMLGHTFRILGLHPLSYTEHYKSPYTTIAIQLYPPIDYLASKYLGWSDEDTKRVPTSYHLQAMQSSSI